MAATIVRQNMTDNLFQGIEMLLLQQVDGILLRWFRAGKIGILISYANQ